MGATSAELKDAYNGLSIQERQELKDKADEMNGPSGPDRSFGPARKRLIKAWKYRLLRVMVEMDEVLDMDIIALLSPRTRLFEDGEVATDPVYSSGKLI